jgi:preprotein translocase subunit SecA
VLIVDEFTGRVLQGRRWSEGLHQAIEAKEGLAVRTEPRTVASISYQSFFRLFPRLAGMTGTAATDAAEIRETYGLEVVVVPTALPVVRRDYPDVVFRTSRGKLLAVVAEIRRLHLRKVPVLVGTESAPF